MRIHSSAIWFVPLVWFFFTLGACASRSPRADLDRVGEGMDKARVLEIAGNPKRTFHQQGQDHWIYVFFEGDRELAQQVDFRDGVVIKVNAATARANFAGRLENADSMEEFEKTVKEHGQKSSGFRDVPADGKL